MPAGGAASRANQKTALAAVIHEKKVDAGLGDLLRQLQEEQEVRAVVGWGGGASRCPWKDDAGRSRRDGGRGLAALLAARAAPRHICWLCCVKRS